MLDLRSALGRRAAGWVRCVRLPHGERTSRKVCCSTNSWILSQYQTDFVIFYCTIWIYNTLGTTRCCTSVSVVSTSTPSSSELLSSSSSSRDFDDSSPKWILGNDLLFEVEPRVRSSMSKWKGSSSMFDFLLDGVVLESPVPEPESESMDERRDVCTVSNHVE